MTKRILFTAELHKFLIELGYTHMQLLGVRKKLDKEKNEETDDAYILIPLKDGISLFEDADLRIEPIASNDISDMLDVEFGINFWVELPDKVATAYKNFTSS